MPQFSTRLRVPIGQERMTGYDLADSLGPLIHADSSGTGPLELRFGGELGRVELGEILYFEVVPFDVRAELAEIELDGPPPDTVRFRPAQVLPFPVGPEGVLTQVDPFNFSVDPIHLGTIEEFERIDVASGELLLSLTNRLPVALSGSRQSGHALRLELHDLSHIPNRVVATWVVADVLAPGQTLAAALDLAGKTLGNRLAVTLSGGSPGSGGETITVLPSHGLDLSLALSALRVHYLQAPAPAMSFEARGTLDLAPIASLVWAEVAHGQLAWNLTSTLPIAATVRVALPNLIVASTSQPLAAEVHIGAHGTRRVVFDLEGERLEAQGDSSLDWRLSVVTEASTETLSLSAQDGIAATIEPATIELRAMEAVLQPTKLMVEPVQIAVDVPSEVDDAEFQAAALTVDLYNTSAAAGLADLVVVGRAERQQVVLPLRIEVPAGTPDLPALARLELNETNSSILELIRLRPDSVEVSGMLFVGDGETTLRVSAGDAVAGFYSVVAPLRLVMQSVSHTGEPFELELSENVREHIRGHLDALVLEAEVENHFPVSAEIEVDFARAAENLLSADDLVLRTGRVAAGQVDPESGRVTASSVTSVQLAVVAGDVELFTAEQIHGAVVAHLSGGEQPVEFHTDDYLLFQGVATLEVAVR